MSSFGMIKCDNENCHNYAHENEMSGWIRLKKKESGDIYDGDYEVAYCLKVVGDSPDSGMEIELPDVADYCCLDCFLIAMGLR